MAAHAATHALSGRTCLAKQAAGNLQQGKRAARVVARAERMEGGRQGQAQVMGLAAAASVVLAAGAAFATPVDIFDDRKAIDAGLLEIYEARDLDISVKGKEGGDRFAFKKSLPIDQVAARAKAAAARFDGEVLPAINKGYWTEAREAMRRAMGTLRYDINTLAEAKGVTKAAKVVTKDTFKKIDALDFAIKNKDKEAALDSFVAAKAAVDAEIASLV